MKHTYNDEQKARIRGMIAAFEGAKKHLLRSVKSGSGICWAIELWLYADYYEPGKWDRANWAYDAKQLIRRALGSYPWLGSWQIGEGHQYTRGMDSLPVRRAWLDQLITDCKAALEE